MNTFSFYVHILEFRNHDHVKIDKYKETFSSYCETPGISDDVGP